MPDYSYLAGGVQVDPFAIATKAQNLQNLQLAGQGQQISNATTGGNLNEVQNARAVISSQGALNPDGSLTDATRLKLAQVAPTQGSSISNNSAIANTNQTGASMAHFQYTQAQAAAANNGLQALYGDSNVMGQRDPATGALVPGSIDPIKATTSIMTQVHKLVAGGVPEEQAMMQAAPLLMLAGHNPEGLPNAIGTYVKQAGGPATTISANNPQMVNTGNATQNVGPLSQNNGGPQTITNTLPPTTPIVKPTADGKYQGSYAGSDAASSAPSYSPADQTRADAATSSINATRTALADPASGPLVQHHINSTLLKLLSDPDTKTGVSASKQAQYEGFLANTPLVGKLFTQNGTTNLNEVNAYLDRLALTNATTLTGGNTDAARSMVAGATGNTSMDNASLAEKIKFGDAIAGAAQAYGQGMDKAVGTGNSQNPLALDQFRSAWTANNDPMVFRLNQAKARGDQSDYNATLNQIKAMPPDQRAAVLQHAKNIQSLTSTGQLAQ